MGDALRLVQGLVVDDRGSRWGDTAEPWQVEDVTAILDQSPGAVRRHFITRPKDGRKTADLAAVNIAALLEQVPDDGRCYALATDREQVSLLLDSMRGFQLRTPGLMGAFSVFEDKARDNRRGAMLEALPADAASTQGIRGHLITADEIHEWNDTRRNRRLWSNLLQGLEKSLPDGELPRFAAITNAGSPVSLAGRARKLASGSRHWRLSEVPGPLPWKTAEQLEALRESCDTEAEYERLHLNRWVEGPDRLATLEDVELCMSLTGPLPPEPGHRYVIGVDLSLRRDLSAAVVMHAEIGERRWVDGRDETFGRRLVVDQLQVWEAARGRDVDMTAIEAWLFTMASQYRAKVCLEQYQAASIQQGLLTRGIDAELTSPTEASNNRQITILMSLLHDHAIALPEDDGLLAEITTVPVVETRSGLLKLGDDRTAGRGHHDRLSALGIAVHELMVGQSGRPLLRRHVVQTGWRAPAPGGSRIEQMQRRLVELGAQSPYRARSSAHGTGHRR
jgi:hypothetical protein